MAYLKASLRNAKIQNFSLLVGNTFRISFASFDLLTQRVGELEKQSEMLEGKCQKFVALKLFRVFQMPLACHILKYFQLFMIRLCSACLGQSFDIKAC